MEVNEATSSETNVDNSTKADPTGDAADPSVNVRPTGSTATTSANPKPTGAGAATPANVTPTGATAATSTANVNPPGATAATSSTPKGGIWGLGRIQKHKRTTSGSSASTSTSTNPQRARKRSPEEGTGLTPDSKSQNMESDINNEEELPDLDDAAVLELEDRVKEATLNSESNQEQLRDEPPTKRSYADKVKARTPAKHLLYIQSSAERRLPLPESHWNLIREVLTDGICGLIVEGTTNIVINWSSYSSKRGLVACANEPTMLWVQAAVQHFQLGNREKGVLRFRAWRRNEYGDKVNFTAFFADHYRKAGGKKVFEMVKKVIKIRGNIEFLEWLPVKPRGFVLKVLADKEATSDLKARGSGFLLPTGSKIHFIASKGTPETANIDPGPSTSGASNSNNG